MGPKAMKYDMPFREWATSAKVRSPLSEEYVGRNDWENGLLFTPELVPCVAHPIVQRRGPEAARWLLAQALYANLEFTQVLEHQVVNNAVYTIARGESGFVMPAQMTADAWNILVDESFHGKLTADLSRRVQALTGIGKRVARVPAFYLRLQREFARADVSIRPLLPLFFCSISETLITRTLVEIPRDPRVIDAVRQVMKDHAEDESKHHRFFASFMTEAWPQLSERMRQRIGPLLPTFMSIFIDTDIAGVRSQLCEIGLDDSQADEVIEQCYGGQNLIQARRNGATASIRTLQKIGVTDSAHVQDELVRLGLVCEDIEEEIA